MKLNAALIVCIICALIAIILLAIVAVQQPFPVFHGSSNSSIVDVTQDIGAADSRFLWNNDGLALIAQAFVLFAAAAATLGLLKINEEKQHA